MYYVQTSPNYFLTQKCLFHMNDKYGFIVVSNWATLDNWGATQGKTMLARPVSAILVIFFHATPSKSLPYKCNIAPELSLHNS